MNTKVLVLGTSGMLGHAVFRLLADSPGHTVFGSARSSRIRDAIEPRLHDRLICGVDAENQDSLTRAIASTRPDVVVNCIGLVKQLADANDPLIALPINALLPHRLAHICELAGARLVHISTDCVFSGTKGMYTENDPSDAQDLYGRSKYLGEVDSPYAITLRTSIIGHELGAAHGLVGWFLTQQQSVNGYTKAIFSGLPTVELARTIRDYVIPQPQLHGLYHVSAEPISKHDLLRLVAQVYGKSIEIIPDDRVRIDRSLDSTRFRSQTGYTPKPWAQLIADMHQFR
jgi:dTDP-4-dehydrorhamnose reductase